ncbi:CaiB/BaiF CoA-transferase family protein [Streptosporangium sp. NPDC001681]|uniref:CaiB/BaiF CoA transferase family protein n=1 Tax=Streptosporangium sp. NPDC001681 TaxID=3154395 RepID=UPI0033180B10
MLPLSGVTVVALEQAVAAPFATRQLADLGARVIKVERPGAGDFARDYDRTVHGESSYFVWLNRGKESIELDIKSAADRAVLDAIIDRVDVLVQNLTPGAVERLGLDAVTLRERRPELIHCSISGYGTGGPDGARKAYDLLVQCEAGLVMATGTSEEPSKVGISIADIATGMYAYSGILTALLQRVTQGVGATIEVAMIDALGEWMLQPAYYSGYGGQATRRTGARHASIAPYGPYAAGDGALVFLSVQNDREWERLCREVLDRSNLVEDPRFAHNPERVANDAAIRPLIEAAFSRLGVDEVVARLDAARIACARMRTPADLLSHPQLLARERWRTVTTSGSSFQALLPPASIVGQEAPMGAVPRLGEHNDLLRAEFLAPRDVVGR